MKRIAAMLVLAGLLLVTSCGGGESSAHKKARTDAKTEAGYYCTMTPAGNAANYIYSEEYKNCVKAQTTRFLGEWEAAHPD